MKLNHKQIELIDDLAKEIEQKFPEVKYVRASPTPDVDNGVLIHFTKPDSDERFMELSEYASDRATDILLEYGYFFVVFPYATDGEQAAAA
ncbi:MAG: hypothetical protein ACREOO_15220 [bacterium]